MTISTTRFGELKINENDVLAFNDGILGFENLKNFIVVDPGDSTLILWLQSVDKSDIAFPIIEPKIFKPDYVAKLLPMDMDAVELESLNDAKIYTVLTIPSDLTKMSANLKAPIVINNKKNLAKQIVLQDSKLPVQFEMYKDLKTYIVNYSSDDAKRTDVELTRTEETENTAVKAEVTPAKNLEL